MGLCIKKKDYEKYSLILPYRFLFGKRRNSYLNSELEKLHPCFSDEFCFDPDFGRPTRKGVSAEVLVMHKYKLAEYEGRHSFAGTGFLAEGGNHHKYFVAERFKVLCGAAVFLVIFSVVILTGLSRRGVAVEVTVPVDVPVVEVEETAVEAEPLVLGPLLFEAVSSCDGKLTSLQWRTDGFHETLEAAVKGVYPEQLNCFQRAGLEKEISFNTVYEKELPVIEFSAVRKIRNKAVQGQSQNAGGEDKAFYSEVRNVLRGHGAVIQQEVLSPYKVKFVCSGTPEFFSELAEVMVRYEKPVCGLSLTENAGKLEVELSCETDGYSGRAVAGIDLKVISENLGLFIRKQEKKSQTKIAAKTVQSNQIEKGLVKIGEIKASDGHRISYYKTGDGKIKRIREE